MPRTYIMMPLLLKFKLQSVAMLQWWIATSGCVEATMAVMSLICLVGMTKRGKRVVPFFETLPNIVLCLSYNTIVGSLPRVEIFTFHLTINSPCEIRFYRKRE